jgi:hypothetical protein
MTPIHNIMVSDLVGSLCWWTRMVSMTAWLGPDRQLDKRTNTERGMRVGERAHRADRRRGAMRSTCTDRGHADAPLRQPPQRWLHGRTATPRLAARR